MSATLNSTLIAWLYTNQSATSIKDDFPQITLSEVGALPIRKIDFSSSEQERREQEAVLREHFETGNREALLRQIETALQANLSVVGHDALVYLAQQMVELNSFRRSESDRWLSWLEALIGMSIDELIGKTTVQNYLGDYQKGEDAQPFDAVLDQLLKPANARKMKVNIRDTALQGRIRQEYEKSLEVLLPIKQRLKESDDLIDQIVYRLYDLTDDEIAIVEGRATD